MDLQSEKVLLISKCRCSNQICGTDHLYSVHHSFIQSIVQMDHFDALFSCISFLFLNFFFLLYNKVSCHLYASNKIKKHQSLECLVKKYKSVVIRCSVLVQKRTFDFVMLVLVIRSVGAIVHFCRTPPFNWEVFLEVHFDMKWWSMDVLSMP